MNNGNEPTKQRGNEPKEEDNMNRIEQLINRNGKELTALKTYNVKEERIIKDIIKTLDKETDIVRILVWEDYIDVTLKNNATPVTFYFVNGYTDLILNKIKIYCKLNNIEFRRVNL